VNSNKTGHHSPSKFTPPQPACNKRKRKRNKWKTTNKSTPSPQISCGFETISTISKRYDGRPAAEVGWYSYSLTVGTRKKWSKGVYSSDEKKTKGEYKDDLKGGQPHAQLACGGYFRVLDIFLKGKQYCLFSQLRTVTEPRLLPKSHRT